MPVSKLRGPLAAYRYRDFRYIWGSGVATYAGFSIEQVIVGWLILEMTNSPALVGLVATCRFAGFWFGPLWGIVADRFNRKYILIAATAASSVIMFILTALAYTQSIQIWHIFILMFLAGATRNLIQITGQSALPDIVDKRDLSSAVGMRMVAWGITLMTMPLAAGYLYEQIGAPGCFAAMAGINLVSCLLILPLRLTGGGKTGNGESLWRSLAEGVSHITRDKSLIGIMLLSAVANFFIWTCVVSILPVFTRDVLAVGAVELGWLTAAEGLGGLLGALLSSSLGSVNRKGWLPIIAMISWASLLIIFSSLRWLPLSLGLLIGIGICRSLTFSTFHILCLTWSPEVIRARVMGIYFFTVGSSPLGSLFLGIGADWWGSAMVIFISASISLGLTLIISLWASELRQRETSG